MVKRKVSGLRSQRYMKRFRRAVKSTRIYRYKRRGLSSNVHFFKRWGTQSSITVNYPNTTYAGSETFALSNIVNSTELVSLYDQYKIVSVVARFQLVNNPDATYMPGITTTTSSSGSNYYPRLWYYRDYDDNSTLTLDGMREVGKAKCKTLMPNKPISIKLRPAVALQLYRSQTTTGYAPAWPKKLDCSQPDIPHYGIKWVFDGLGIARRSEDQWIIKVDYLYYIKMHNTR